MARRKIVAGNWKMNMTPSQAAGREELSTQLTFPLPNYFLIPLPHPYSGCVFPSQLKHSGNILINMIRDISPRSSKFWSACQCCPNST